MITYVIDTLPFFQVQTVEDTGADTKTTFKMLVGKLITDGSGVIDTDYPDWKLRSDVIINFPQHIRGAHASADSAHNPKESP